MDWIVWIIAALVFVFFFIGDQRKNK